MPDEDKDKKDDDSGSSGGGDPANVPDERIAKFIACGLIDTGVEGAYDSVSCSTAGDYPSMGCSQWEGIGGRGDALLSKIPGGEAFVGKAYSAIDVNALKQILGSEAGQKAQLETLASDAASYVSAIHQVGITEPRMTIYAGMWAPSSTSCTCNFAKNHCGSLDEMYTAFRDSYYIAAQVGSQYALGYSNRATKCYNYVKQADLSKDPAPGMHVNMNGGPGGGGGVNIVGELEDKWYKIVPLGGAITVKKLPYGKTMCEPIYPDYVTVSDTVPQWVLDIQDEEAGNQAGDGTNTQAKEDAQKKIDGQDGDSHNGEKGPNGRRYFENDIQFLMKQ